MRGNLRDRWRREVLRTSDVSDSVKVLLLVMADAMKEDGYVSVPRGVLCEALDKRDRVVAERLKLAVEARLIDRVQRGQKGRTSVYRALLPDPLSKRSHSTLSGGRVPVQGAVPARAERRPLGVQGVVSTDAERTEPQHPERPFSRPPVPRASSKPGSTGDLDVDRRTAISK